MQRRRFLQVTAAVGVTGIAGCNSRNGRDAENNDQSPSVVYVGPGGNDSNTGTEAEPFETIQHAVNTVDPGGTVDVLPGEYRQFVGIHEDDAGEAGAPITLTGPPDAVLKPPEQSSVAMYISASHFHLTGLTIDGLLDEDNPDDPDSYNEPQLVGVSPEDPDPKDPHYVENLVLSPHAMGNTQSAFINAALLKESEIGGFKVTGLAGAEWILGDTDGHNGEFVYLGTAPNNLERNQGIEVYDQTRNIHVHHIDNSEGHPHSELVDCKIGTRNVTIEYCTDAGGAQSEDSYYQSAISLDGRECTVRWNVIQDAFGNGIQIGPNALLSSPGEFVNAEPETEFEQRMGKAHAIYGNVFTGCKHEAVNFHRESAYPGRNSNPLPEDQRVLCGNLYDGYSDASPADACPEDLPTGDGVGHLGDNSPWPGTAPSREEVFEQHATAPHLDVTVHEDTIPAGRPIEIPVTISNNADTADDVVLGLRVREHLLTEETVTVPAGDEREITLTESLNQTLELEVMRNEQKIGSVYLT